jgi:hypothetical protein
MGAGSTCCPKAGDITLHSTMDIRGHPTHPLVVQYEPGYPEAYGWSSSTPSAGPHLPWHILQGSDPLCGPCQHEAGFAGSQPCAGRVQVALVFLDFDGHRHDVVVELSVAGNLPRETPVPSVSHSLLEYLEVGPQSGEHVSEPRWEWLKW